ncbi:MAG: ABC transporter ATP-binding protein [Proteobacteria bacterium]|nr:ABC transporter ATP-binding protein [Pseudomonadota bacterium]MBU1545146.1 ABC transporter ATP-binding protein [Pseudomonadota bacterium]MBU2618254.1 ABC transporter ATP-binding protein [Pseudomonadota bacterium]
MQAQEKPVQHLIEIRDIGKDYQVGANTVSAIRHMHFHVDDGEFISIMGQSGSGKSTLLAVLGGLNHPSRGQVLVDSLDVYGLSSEQRADFRSEYIGIIFQSFQLIPYLTALENIKLPMAITGISAKEQDGLARSVLEKVGLGAKAPRLPDQLSGGEQERVAIARAIVNRPPILLADEPTGSLDSETAEGVMGLLRRLNQEGLTIIMVTHNPDACRHADRTILVRDGLCLAQ